MLDDLKNILRGSNFISKIILINAIIFVVYTIIAQFSPAFVEFVSNWFSLPASLSKFIFRPWTIITYMFLHSGLGHVFFNMYILYFFGRIFGDFMGQQRLTGLYFLGGIVGGLLYLVVYNLLYLSGEMSENVLSMTAMVGASAGVMAVVIAAGARFGDYTLNLLFIGPVKLKYVALFLFITSTLFNFMSNFGGNVAHVGGAALGFLYIRQLAKGQDWAFAFHQKIEQAQKLFEKKPKLRVVPNDYGAKKANTTTSKKAAGTDNETQAKTDAILDKISKSGYDNLSKEEKEFLFKLSKNR
jgi:membrane associated rhomboid family serine protease